MSRTSDEWVQAYIEKGALWMHDGNPRRPHPVLSSGNHSNGFFNSRSIIDDKLLLRDAASDLLDAFLDAGGELRAVEVVVGPQTGATLLANYISDEVAVRAGRVCRWASPAKGMQLGKPVMVFSDEEKCIVQGRAVLLCEDVFTTGGSVGLAALALKEASGIPLPFIVTIVNRSEASRAHSNTIASLVHRHLPIWEPHACPLCMEGSEAIRPKGDAEWARLKGVC